MPIQPRKRWTVSQINRLNGLGRVNEKKPIDFYFNDQHYQGLEGDTLASALLANNVMLVGRSFKYHRPRGIMGSGFDEGNALVQLEDGAYTVPNIVATQIPLYEGLRARSVNCWPNVKYDFGAITGLFSRLMPPGFYYKTFMRPKKLFKYYEKGLRHMAGFGHSPVLPDPQKYEQMNAHCDILVIGGGLLGVFSAYYAAKSGARVILVDNQRQFGGQILQKSDTHAVDKLNSFVTEMRALENVTLLSQTVAFGCYDHNMVNCLQSDSDFKAPCLGQTTVRQRLWRIRTKHIILATGAIERPIAFANNDRPGILLSSAISNYINQFGVLPGQNCLLFTNNDQAYQTALDILNVGGQVAGIVDSRRQQRPLHQKLIRRGVPIFNGYVVYNTKGRQRITEATLCPYKKADRLYMRQSIVVQCDLLGVSGGMNPLIHLGLHLGDKPIWRANQACFTLKDNQSGLSALGKTSGYFDREEAMRHAQVEVSKALKQLNIIPNQEAPAKFAILWDADQSHFANTLEPLFVVEDAHVPNNKKFIDFQNDVSARDLSVALEENFTSIEHVKRYTMLGFGTDQGRLGNIVGMGYVAQQLGKTIPEVGTTTFRPPFTPVTFGALAGKNKKGLYDPVRHTPMHAWHVKQGAMFENVGQWKRPWFYPKPGESMQEAVKRECLATHNSVGLLDGSTLGKIDIKGPDSAEFLNRIYTNNWLQLKVGACRYGLMLNEQGMVFDDGVTVRLADDHFLMTTTSGGAAQVLAWLEYWLQTEWPELKVYLNTVTDQFATLIVSGPNSRKVMQKLNTNIDFSKEAFPFMQSVNGNMEGIPIRVLRMSFTGELSFELYVPSDYGQAVWDKVMAVGKEFDITPYGTETMHVLRAEKGFLIVGQDTDGSVTPNDLGMDWILAKKKDYLGRRSLMRSDMVRTGRKQLVGLLPEDPKIVLEEGAQIICQSTITPPVLMQGHVTSSYYSAILERGIAMALIKDGHKRWGQAIYVTGTDQKIHRAIITKMPFYDKEGARQNV